MDSKRKGRSVRNLTTGDVLEITNTVVRGMTADVVHPAGLTPKEFNTWLRKGVVVPAVAGKGRGQHRQFTLLQAVAIVYAAQWWRNGAGLETVRQVVGCVTKFDERGLRREIAAGRLFAVPILGLGCRLIKPTKKWLREVGVDRIPAPLDLQFNYSRVVKKIAELGKRPGNAKGRSRGTSSK